MSYCSFEALDVWKRACCLAVRVYEVLQACRDFGLKDPLTRSAVSIASNLAEGSERNSRPDDIRFLPIAKGSAAELRTPLYIAYKVGLITKELRTERVQALKEISAMLQVLANALKPNSFSSLKLKT